MTRTSRPRYTNFHPTNKAIQNVPFIPTTPHAPSRSAKAVHLFGIMFRFGRRGGVRGRSRLGRYERHGQQRWTPRRSERVSGCLVLVWRPTPTPPSKDRRGSRVSGGRRGDTPQEAGLSCIVWTGRRGSATWSRTPGEPTCGSPVATSCLFRIMADFLFSSKRGAGAGRWLDGRLGQGRVRDRMRVGLGNWV